MPRPGQLTRTRANRLVRTPGGRLVIHRRKIYKTAGRCAITGKRLNLLRGGRQDRLIFSSRSAKRPNRPYGGVITPGALRRALITAVRKQ